MHLSLMIAIADNGVIGAEGGLPWRLPADLRRFKAITWGKPVVMGRKTWESLPKKPLPGRQNIVITRQTDYVAEGARVVGDLDSALWAAADVEEVFVLGGAEIYALALPKADRIYLTEVHAAPDGDVLLPALAPGAWRDHWREVLRENFPASDTAPAFSFVILEPV